MIHKRGQNGGSLIPGHLLQRDAAEEEHVRGEGRGEKMTLLMFSYTSPASPRSEHPCWIFFSKIPGRTNWPNNNLSGRGEEGRYHSLMVNDILSP